MKTSSIHVRYVTIFHDNNGDNFLTFHKKWLKTKIGKKFTYKILTKTQYPFMNLKNQTLLIYKYSSPTNDEIPQHCHRGKGKFR